MFSSNDLPAAEMRILSVQSAYDDVTLCQAVSKFRKFSDKFCGMLSWAFHFVASVAF